MKKFLSLLILLIITTCLLCSCNIITNLIPGLGNGQQSQPEDDVITVENGYLVVNGVKTQYKIYSDPVVSVIDGYIAVNGVKTQYKVDTDDVIEVIGGYLVVNGVQTNYQVKTPDVIEVINGYLVVNGVKTDYMVSNCNHIWETLTTAPTCTTGGYDTMICKVCAKSVTTNDTSPLGHSYNNSYSFDNDYHWLECTRCGDIKDKAAHTPDSDGVCTSCSLPSADTPGIIYDISSDGTYAEVIGYSGTASKIKIASTYKGLPVKGIYTQAFLLCDNMTTLVIPEGVESIGVSAFSGCYNLTDITLPSTLKNIGSSAFMGCPTANVYINDLDAWLNKSYSMNSFDCGYNLYLNGNIVENLVIPSGITNIPNDAFGGCYSLVSVVMGDDITSIGNGAFYRCSNLTNITIGNNVTTIGNSAFRYCSKLTSIYIPDSVTKIGAAAFAESENLTTIRMSSNISGAITETVFEGCYSLKFNEYDNCNYIGNEVNPYLILVNAANPNYSRYEIASGTVIIADEAFDDCHRLSNVVLPVSLKHVGHMSFGGQITDVYYEGTEADWNQIFIHEMGNENLHSATKHYNYTSV